MCSWKKSEECVRRKKKQERGDRSQEDKKDEMRTKTWPTCTCKQRLQLYQVGMHGDRTRLKPVFNTSAPDAVPCPGGYKKYTAAEVLETGY